MTTHFSQLNRPGNHNLEWRPGEVITLFEDLDFERLSENDLGGYFGEVFLVQELNSKIKMIAKSVGERKDQVDKMNAIEAFKREAYALLNLPPHPNIVQSFIVHKVKRKDYIFMEHVDGGNLLEYIKSCNKESKKKNLNELYSIIHQMAEGLRFIHSNGFVHKDLKHDNILVSNGSHNFLTVKIADFGLMSIRNPIIDNYSVNDQNDNIILETTKSKIGIRSSRIFATDYASPELTQSIVIDEPINHLADIFTFGLLVLELITGVIGFKTVAIYESFLPLFAKLSNSIDIERTNDILQQRIEEFLKSNRSDVNPRLKILIKKCMEVQPSKRYQNFDEILKVINGITRKNILNNYGKSKYDPSISSILFYGIRGLSLIGMGFKDRGEIMYDYAISLPCNSKADHTNKGMILVEKKRYSEAIAEFDAASLIDPTDPTPYINRGSIYTTTSRYAKAISEYNKVIKINSKDYLPYSNRGNVFRHLGNYKEAIHSYDRALLRKPTYIKAIINKIGCLRHMKHFDEAMLLVRRALILDPWDNSIHRLRINIQSDLAYSH